MTDSRSSSADSTLVSPEQSAGAVPPAARLPVQVPFLVHNPAAQSMRHSPLSCGVPLPRGQVSNWNEALLCNALGERTPAQLIALKCWPDGSVRWLLVDALLDEVPPGESAWQLRFEPAETVTAGNVWAGIIRQLSGSYALSLPDGVLEVGSCSTRPLQWKPTEQTTTDISAEFLFIDQHGQSHLAEFSVVELETIGPVRFTFLLHGNIPTVPALRCHLRLAAYAATGLLKLEVKLHNAQRAQHPGGLWDLGDAGSVLFKAWKLRLHRTGTSCASETQPVAWQVDLESPIEQSGPPVSIYQDSSGGENWQSPVHLNREGRVPVNFRGYQVQANSAQSAGLRASPTLAWGQSPSVALAIPEFWQQFPLALSASADALEAGFFPGQTAELHELQGGEQKTHTVWMQVSSKSPQDAVAQLAGVAHQPLQAMPTRDWCHTADAFPYLGECQLHPVSQKILQAAIAGPESLFAKRETIDEYGWRNYGDVWADHEQAYYEGEGQVVSHYNNQFDMLAGAWQQMLLTGDWRWQSIAAPLARHVLDIDLYRTEQDRSAYNQGLFWFTDHYFTASTATHRTFSRTNIPDTAPDEDPVDYGGGPGSEHNFATGLLYHYWLTGDADAAEGVRLLADWVLAMDDGRQNLLGLLDDGPTGLASMCGNMQYHGPGRGAANSIQVLLDAWLLTESPHYLAYAQRLIRRVIHPADDVAARNLLVAEERWSYTMLLAALVRFLNVKAESVQFDADYWYARESLLTYARWMAEHERPYLDRPTELEFPTEAWAAQDLRKANVLRLAADFAPPSEAPAMRRRGEALANRAWADLQAFATRNTTRSVAIVMIEGIIDGNLRAGQRTPQPEVSPTKYDFGQPESFLPQQARIRAALRTPAGWLRLIYRAARPAAWWRVFRLWRRSRRLPPVAPMYLREALANQVNPVARSSRA